MNMTTSKDEAVRQDLLDINVRIDQDELMGTEESFAELVKYIDAMRAERFDAWKDAAERGVPEGQVLIADRYCEDKNFTEAAEWYRKAAEQRYAEAQYALGNCYSRGEGVARDKAEAIEWFRKAAEQGYVKAQYELGVRSIKDTEAIEWLRKAAERGHAKAQSRLASKYELGDGVSRDKEEAIKWLHKSAEQGYLHSQYRLAKSCFEGNGIYKNKTKAVQWFRKAAERGDPSAQYWLAECYFYGDGIPEDKAEAVKWYLKAAEKRNGELPLFLNGDPRWRLAECYCFGEGVPEDRKEAMKWFREVAADAREETSAEEFLRKALLRKALSESV